MVSEPVETIWDGRTCKVKVSSDVCFLLHSVQCKKCLIIKYVKNA